MNAIISHWSCGLYKFLNNRDCKENHYIRGGKHLLQKTHWLRIDRFTWSLDMNYKKRERMAWLLGSSYKNNLIFRFFEYVIKPILSIKNISSDFTREFFILNQNFNFKIGSCKQ